MPGRQLPIPLRHFASSRSRINMEWIPHPRGIRVLLVSIFTISCGAFPLMIVESPRQHRAEPFTTFHRLDRQISVLGKQSAALQKTATASQPEHKGADPPWDSVARQMGHTATTIDKLALSL